MKVNYRRLASGREVQRHYERDFGSRDFGRREERRTHQRDQRDIRDSRYA